MSTQCQHTYGTDHQALLDIQELMDGVEWSPETLDAIAVVLTRAGYAIREVDDSTVEEADSAEPPEAVIAPANVENLLALVRSGTLSDRSVAWSVHFVDTNTVIAAMDRESALRIATAINTGAAWVEDRS